MEQPKLINNINERVVDDLENRLSQGSRVSIAAASFSIYAFEALKKELEEIDELRFIFTSPTFIKEKSKKEKREYYIPKLNRERSLYGTEFEVRLRNQLSQKAIAKECAEWIRQKVKFRSNSSQEQMGGFLHTQTNGLSYVYLPFNEFTTTQLGCDARLTDDFGNRGRLHHLHRKQRRPCGMFLRKYYRQCCKGNGRQDAATCTLPRLLLQSRRTENKHLRTIQATYGLGGR